MFSKSTISALTIALTIFTPAPPAAGAHLMTRDYYRNDYRHHDPYSYDYSYDNEYDNGHNYHHPHRHYPHNNHEYYKRDFDGSYTHNDRNTFGKGYGWDSYNPYQGLGHTKLYDRDSHNYHDNDKYYSDDVNYHPKHYDDGHYYPNYAYDSERYQPWHQNDEYSGDWNERYRGGRYGNDGYQHNEEYGNNYDLKKYRDW